MMAPLIQLPISAILIDVLSGLGFLTVVLISGRMIPAMAMVSQVVGTNIRGTFMSLMGSVQMLSSGLASVVAGAIVTIGPDGKMLHYNIVGYGAVACGLITFCLVGYIHTDKEVK